MTFYSANNTGINNLTPDEIQNTIPDSRKPSGYLSKEELALALTNKDCVGIRVYKTGRRTRSITSDELIVCGVLENGFDAPEKNVGFLDPKKDTIFQMIERISVLPENDTFEPKAASRISRQGVEVHLSDDTPLLAYFSLAMLNRLLDDAQVAGILLYEADLTSIQVRVPHLSVPAPLKLESYVAFAAQRAENEEVRLPDFDQSEPHVLSNQPCPGHCLQIDPKGAVSIGEMVAIQANFDENPYPKPWDNA